MIKINNNNNNDNDGHTRVWSSLLLSWVLMMIKVMTMKRKTAGVPVTPSEERWNGDDQEKSRQSCQIGRGYVNHDWLLGKCYIASQAHQITSGDGKMIKSDKPENEPVGTFALNELYIV